MLCDFIYLTPPIPWISTTQNPRSPPPLPCPFPFPPSLPQQTLLTQKQPHQLHPHVPAPSPQPPPPKPHHPTLPALHSTPLHSTPLHSTPIHSIPFHPPTPLHPEPSTRGADCLSVGGMLTYCMGPSEYFPKKQKNNKNQCSGEMSKVPR